MKRNNFFSRFILVTLTAALLLMSGSRAIPVSALADPQYVAPIYDTEIIQLKNYIESGQLSAPQLPIFYFLLGSLAVAQLGSQDAMLKSPYPVASDIHEWFINMGINLYNSLIVLVPEGDYYVGSVDMPAVPKQVIKALVAQAMGDAVVARNYPDLDAFLAANPDNIFVPFTRDIQLGVNALFQLNGGTYEWQIKETPFNIPFSWQQTNLGQLTDLYNEKLALLTNKRIFANTYSNDVFNLVISPVVDYDFDVFINTSNNTFSMHFPTPQTQIYFQYVCVKNGQVMYGTSICSDLSKNVNLANYNSYADVINTVLTNPSNYRFMNFYVANGINLCYPAYTMMIDNYYAGPSWESRELVQNLTDLNYEIDQTQYFQQITNDYLLDLRGLIGDLVNYVYVRQPVFDNIYDPDGTLVLPDLINVSVDLTPITDLLAPPIPVNMNDIAELTDNTYLERVKEHARNAGDIFANYVAFWHNCDSDLVYTMFGAAILVLVGAFVGKWGHS